MVDAAVPGTAAYRLWDSDLKGFGLKVSPAGVKTLFVWYRAGSGRTAPRREFTIGRYGAVTVEQARDAAAKVISQARLGGDPQAERAAVRRELTVAEVCDRYLVEGVAMKKASTIATDRGRIERHIKPLLGAKRISEIKRADVDRFQREVAEGRTATSERLPSGRSARVTGGKGTAARTLGFLGAIMEFAVERRLIAVNPVRGVKRYRDRRCERFLSAAELGRLGDALREADGTSLNPKAVQIIRLLALTGARRGEIAGLRWAEVDAERSCLRLADSKTGQKVVPLGAAALAALLEVPRAAGSAFVFPGDRDPRKHFKGASNAWVIIKKMAGLPDVRLHDLRHSFASVGLASGQGLPLIGKLLGHASISTTQRYAHLADDPVKSAADRISAEISGSLNRHSERARSASS